MKRPRKGYKNFEEIYDLEFDSDKTIHERVLRNDFSKLYTLKDVSQWIEYGIRHGLVRKSPKKEDVEMMMKWIDLLGKKKIDI